MNELWEYDCQCFARDDLVKSMNKKGMKGWEAISVNLIGDNCMVIFKRKVPVVSVSSEPVKLSVI
jgi:hypothetical protein